METMTPLKLLWICFKACLRGHWNVPVYFDTEARKFDYHLAKVGSAYCEYDGWRGDDA